MKRLHMTLIVAAFLLALAGCKGGKTERAYSIATGGTPERGEQLIEHFGCGSCHTIPGVHGAHGVVGPPLTDFAKRTYIAGQLPNQPENLIRWIQEPHAIEEGTAMPDLGLTEDQARHVAAYLYTLR